MVMVERRVLMTKSELVAHIAQEAEISKKAASSALDAVVSAITNVLQDGGRIRIADLGSFSIVVRKARVGVNPRTGDSINIPETKAPRFTAAKALKDSVKGD
jgi:DNA-binding protein HU-beta